MRLYEIIAGPPLVVVDVQPAYAKSINFTPMLMNYINNYGGLVVMLVNAEETGVSEDTFSSIQEYWLDNGLKTTKLKKLKVTDKGYGYLRSWMEYTDENTIIKIGKFMVQHYIHDSRDVEEKTETSLADLAGSGYNDDLEDDPMILGWLDSNLIKQMHNCNLCGGARNECLAEVELALRIFDVSYKLINDFTY